MSTVNRSDLLRLGGVGGLTLPCSSSSWINLPQQVLHSKVN